MILANYLTLPQHQLRDLREAPLAPLHRVVDWEVRNGQRPVSEFREPFKDALTFYTLSHFMALIMAKRPRLQKLQGVEAEIVERYITAVIEQSRPLIAYTLYVCWREQRHRTDSSVVSTIYPKEFVQAQHTAWREQFPKATELLTQIESDDGPEKLPNIWRNTDPGDVTLGEFTDAIYRAFLDFPYKKGFGGFSWARIAQPLRQLVHGELSMEGFVDTAYALAHNNGTMFNKGVIYKTPDTDQLTDLLNVQRAGMLPQALINNRWLDNSAALEMKALSERAWIELVGGPAVLANTSINDAVKTLETAKTAFVAAKHQHIEELQAKAVPADSKLEILSLLPDGAVLEGMYTFFPGQVAIKYHETNEVA